MKDWKAGEFVPPQTYPRYTPSRSQFMVPQESRRGLPQNHQQKFGRMPVNPPQVGLPAIPPQARFIDPDGQKFNIMNEYYGRDREYEKYGRPMLQPTNNPSGYGWSGPSKMY